MFITYEDQEFVKYLTTYGKSYGTKEEFDLRSKIFKTNLLKVRMHNARTDVSYKLGINKFSDMTE